jgi:hypothetical protein
MTDTVLSVKVKAPTTFDRATDTAARVRVKLATTVRYPYNLSDSWVPLPPGITYLPAAPAPVEDETYGFIMTPESLLKPYQETLIVDSKVKIEFGHTRLEYALTLPERTGSWKVRAFGTVSHSIAYVDTNMAVRAVFDPFQAKDAVVRAKWITISPAQDSMIIRPKAATISPVQDSMKVSSVVSSRSSGVFIIIPPSVLAWNSPTTTGVALSDDDRTITGTTANGVGRTNTAGTVQSSGKFYFECTVAAFTTSTPSLGLANTKDESSLAGDIGGATFGQSVSYEGLPGSPTLVSGGAFGTISVGTVLMIAVDFDAAKLWLGMDGTWRNSGDPAAGTNPHIYGWSATSLMPATDCGAFDDTQSVTIPETFAYTPAGFDPWPAS